MSSPQRRPATVSMTVLLTAHDHLLRVSIRLITSTRAFRAEIAKFLVASR